MSITSKFLLTKFVSGLTFTVPTWVAFQSRYLNYSQMALMELISSLIAILAQLPTGALADLLGRKKAVFIGFLIAGFGNIATAFAPNGTLLMIGFWVIAIGTTFISGADVAFLYDHLKSNHRTNEFAHINAKGIFLYRTAMILAILTGGYLYRIFIGYPMIAKGIALLFSAFIFISMNETLKSGVDYHKASVNYTDFVHKIKTGISTLFTNYDSRLRSIYYVLIGGITWSVVYQWMNTLANDFGYTPIDQSWLFAIIYIVTNTIMVYVAKINYRVNHRIFLVLFPALTIIGLIPMYWLNKYSAIPFLAILVFLAGSRFSILDAWINHHLDSSHRATTLSTLNLLVTLINGLIIYVFGQIQHRFLTGAAMTLLGMFSFISLIPLTYKLLKIEKPL